MLMFTYLRETEKLFREEESWSVSTGTLSLSVSESVDTQSCFFDYLQVYYDLCDAAQNSDEVKNIPCVSKVVL